MDDFYTDNFFDPFDSNSIGDDSLDSLVNVFETVPETTTKSTETTTKSTETFRKTITRLTTESTISFTRVSRRETFFDYSYLLRLRDFCRLQETRQTSKTTVSMNEDERITDRYKKRIDYTSARFQTANQFFTSIFGLDLRNRRVPYTITASSSSPATINYDIPLTKTESIVMIVRFLIHVSGGVFSLPREATRNLTTITNYVMENVFWIISNYNFAISRRDIDKHLFPNGSRCFV